MASKGQKFRKYPLELKGAILNEYFNVENGCESLSNNAKLMNCSYSDNTR